MNTLSYKTVSVSKEAAREQKEWVVIDATDQVVGRLASKVAKIIRGKYKPTFTPWRQRHHHQRPEGDLHRQERD